MAVAASAPGKVLLAGGFLVLDRKHRGLVFGLDARIHVLVDAVLDDAADSASSNNKATAVVKSPQFKDAEWAYNISSKREGKRGVQVEQVQNSKGQLSSNSFVQVTLAYVLTFLEHIPSVPYKHLEITILADNDYYSNPGTLINENKQFKSFGVPLSSAHKTGLGSSAALVTSLTTALLLALAKDFTVPENQSRIHNLAQAAHCAAQGKVGSGFDVAAAVYGSCLYRRFTPAILERIGESDSEGFGDRLHQCVEDLMLESKWDQEVLKDVISVPSSLRLVMCDVDCGSQTPGMVKKVLGWRKDKAEEADLLWNAIQQGAEDLCRELSSLSLTDETGSTDYQGLRDIIETIRSFVREMSDKSQVPIEPKVQTELLNACSAIPGVVNGVVPGAGGYDAIALLLKNDDVVVQQLREMLEGWQSSVEEADPAAKIGKVRLLDVQQEFEGVRPESMSRYQGWV